MIFFIILCVLFSFILGAIVSYILFEEKNDAEIQFDGESELIPPYVVKEDEVLKEYISRKYGDKR